MVQVPTGEVQPEHDDCRFEIVCPITGEIIDTKNVDQLAESFQRIEKASKHYYAVLMRIREALAGLTEGDAKTRRLQGKRHKVKVTMPADSWDQSKLKEAWHAYPQFRDKFLRLGSVGVQMTPYKQLVNTSSDDPAFVSFRDMVTGANNGQTGTPTVKVEE